ncbi:MAG: dimethylargininase [Candidatus Krumholzibacteria bacterium]|nr:dimethylargininase [Candidatus Krumholzibacteria bacterium]MDH4335680.1 dimethylargininase [Candidatus Krumholzibacteria bacterium]MDH5627344.1 dimethylargininase [Candidatus Krumholzibacteria bacterium]
MSRIAITRQVSRSIVHCELTHLAREPIDYARAVEQHEAYEAALVQLGCEIVRAPAAHDLPDAVFVEDVALVMDEVAVMTRPGAESRRAELPGVEPLLARYRDVVRIEAPGTLDGGDVLLVGRRFFVGRSSRTNDAGIVHLRALVSEHGYSVDAVDVRGCLHLKSAVTAVGESTLLGNGTWVDRGAFGDVAWIDVDPAEPHAANALWVGDGVIYPRAYSRTAALVRTHLDSKGMLLRLVDASELAKAEGGVTCCSLILTSG